MISVFMSPTYYKLSLIYHNNVLWHVCVHQLKYLNRAVYRMETFLRLQIIGNFKNKQTTNMKVSLQDYPGMQHAVYKN